VFFFLFFAGTLSQMKKLRGKVVPDESEDNETAGAQYTETDAEETDPTADYVFGHPRGSRAAEFAQDMHMMQVNFEVAKKAVQEKVSVVLFSDNY
jgi:hypothetical protein